MGEVGVNSSDGPHTELKMNGGINGSCEEEPMDVDSQDDPQDDSHVPNEIPAKQSENDENKNVAIENNGEISTANNKLEPSPESIPPKINSQNDDHENEKFVDHANGDDEAKASETYNDVNKENSNEVILTNDLDKENSRDSNAVLDDGPTSKTIESNDNVPTVRNDSAENAKATENSISDTKHTEDDNTQSTENGNHGGDYDDEIEHIPEVEEVHAISDSEDEGSKDKDVENPLKDVSDDVIEVDGPKSNGVDSVLIGDDDEDEENDEDDDDDDDDDKPVSIHSDSDTENEASNKNEVHEILSDKEDCVVIEDDKKIDGADISSRRINRARKSAVRPRDFSAYDDDIEEVIEDPLEQPASKRFRSNEPNSVPKPLNMPEKRTIVGDPLINSSESQQQFNQTSNKAKEPTLVIIDTNTILSRGTSSTVQALQKQNISVVPVGVPAQGVYPIDSRASITPVPSNNNQIAGNVASATLAGLNAPVLTALTDDMFVLEAPSFIVPYIYEKPPTNDLKDIVTRMRIELDERKKEEEEKCGKVEEEKDSAKDDDGKVEEDENKTKKNEKKKRKPVKNPDDSWDESDTSTDDEASDVEETKVLIKEAKADLDLIKPHIISRDMAKDTSSDEKKDSNNYFDSPLGKFFMDIGVNLVQEYVQTDLLRQQKRKLNREGNQASPSVQVAINSLMKNLELSKGKNDVFKFQTKRCEYCLFRSESSLVMAHHYETPHLKLNIYKCNFCSYEVKPPYDILSHMKNVHNIQSRLEKVASYHQCPNCQFEDNGRSKLARHAIVCGKKFRPEINLAPPGDWEPPAKIPRIKPRHGLVGTANAYQAMAAQAQRAATAAAIQRQNAANAANAAAAMIKNRGRTTITKTSPVVGTNLRTNQQIMRPQMAAGVVLPNNIHLSNAGQFLQPTGTKTMKGSQQPSISITALPRQQTAMPPPTNMSVAHSMQQAAAALPKPPGMGNLKPGQSPQGGKASFVICEICDGYIKDLDQLRNHMQWMHKVKIHPKMIYNRPPLNCQKCQFRFFTDQGLERHLLGSHGLVTSSMQEAANKGKDAGRCPVCGRMYQWKLLNHVSREHNMTLKPAHLSYKCTVCTATFGMYKQFENHVYSAHSTVAKKSNENKRGSASSSSGMHSRGGIMVSGAGDSLLKPLKINDEITIIPQPASRNNRPIEIESHVID